VHSRFRAVPRLFKVYDLTHTVLGDLGVAVWADPTGWFPRTPLAAAGPAGSETGAAKTIQQGRRSRAVRLLFPSDVVISDDGSTDVEGVEVDGTSLPFGRTLLASSPGLETWATLERYICAEKTGRCRWSSEPAARAALDVDTRVRRLRLDSPAFSLTATRQQVLKSMPHWLATPLETCGRRQAAREGRVMCERELFDALVYSAHAPVRAVMGYIDISLFLRNESCAPAHPGTADGGSLAHAAHGLLGQRSCAGLSAASPIAGRRRAAAEPQDGAVPSGGVGHSEALPQGEGYIEGVWTDYAVLGSLWSRRYTFNRFSLQPGSRPAVARKQGQEAEDAHGATAAPRRSPPADSVCV